MRIAVNFIRDDSQCPYVITERKSLLSHHIRTKICWATPQFALSPGLSKVFVPSVEDAVKIGDLGESLSRGVVTWLMRMFYSFRSPCLRERLCMYWTPLEMP
jgi:hypothetical protein